MTRGGFLTVGQAVECLLRLETDEAAYEWLMGQKREEKRDILAELTKVISQAKALAPQSPIAEQQMSTELEKLKIELSQVKGQLARAEVKNKNGSSTRSNPAGGRASSPSAGLQCFQCGGPRLPEETEWPKQLVRTSGGCFKCGGPHFTLDCQARQASLMAPLASYVLPPSPWTAPVPAMPTNGQWTPPQMAAAASGESHALN